MVARRQIILLRAVALAGVEQPAGAIGAQPLDRVARPAAAVALALQAILGRQQAVAAVGGDVALEVGLTAEEAEAALHLPLDARSAAARLGEGERSAPRREQERGQAESKKFSHGGRGRAVATALR